jgi:hypothetical protein
LEAQLENMKSPPTRPTIARAVTTFWPVEKPLSAFDAFWRS